MPRSRADQPGPKLPSDVLPPANDTAKAPRIGERIREVRQANGLSIRQLSARAGVSVSLISQVERGINDPSLQTLRQVAKSLDTPLFDLFQVQDNADVVVVRADRRVCLRSPHGDLAYQRISPGSGKLELLEGLLAPHATSSAEPWSHPSEECVVVTGGTLVVEVGGEVHRLEIGDSVYFDSRLPHRYVNDTGEPTIFTLAVTPPSY